jgi:hypothetical protein
MKLRLGNRESEGGLTWIVPCFTSFVLFLVPGGRGALRNPADVVERFPRKERRTPGVSIQQANDALGAQRLRTADGRLERAFDCARTIVRPATLTLA